ncbi:MAG: bifunctional diaminohydroxyphosphoribosylaminopyrimidine deaminase/5-amino-6-(5-phosphoribosylamino)uracil reductase RibD [Myxococcota bacterium]
MQPEAAMRLALREAARGRGTTFPNPCVGAVVVLGDRVLGRGHSRPAGGAHAEVVAIERAVRAAGAAAVRRATLVVTLEPCAHFGRTPPCTEAIAAAGLRRVVVGARDPHPKAGGGARALRRAGVRVEPGVLEDACRAHHRGFLSVCERGRPWLALKLASTLDGRIATASGESRWITSPRARAFVHALRARTDAVLVGTGTALADDPALTARRGARVARAPVRVLVDRRLRVPVAARLYTEPRGEAWVVCARGARGRRARADAGARVLEVAARAGALDLRAALERLAREGLTEVLCEGGGGLAAGLLRAGLVDEIHWLVAPKLLGGDARPALAALGLGRLRDAVALEDVAVRRLGDDVHVHGTTAQGRDALRATRRRRGG